MHPGRRNAPAARRDYGNCQKSPGIRQAEKPAPPPGGLGDLFRQLLWLLNAPRQSRGLTGLRSEDLFEKVFQVFLCGID